MKQHSYRLTELLVCLVLFSFCTAVCLGLFSRAHTLSGQSRHLSQAVALAQNAAQAVQADAAPEALAAVLSPARQEKNCLTVYYDASGAHCDSDQSAYCLQLILPDTPSALAQIQVSFQEKAVFSLEIPCQEATK